MFFLKQNQIFHFLRYYDHHKSMFEKSELSRSKKFFSICEMTEKFG